MDNPQRLLLIASPLMRRTPVYDRAAALAKAKGMALHIVAFDYLEGLATAGLVNDQTLAVMREGYVQQHREWLETQALSMRRNGVTVTTEVVWVQHPLDEILVHLREQPFAMLIKAFEHEPWWARAMFTSLDIQLLRETRIPCTWCIRPATRCRARFWLPWTCPAPRTSLRGSMTRSSVKR